MRDYLGVGLGHEDVSSPDQIISEYLVVLDDTVVDNSNRALAVQVWMSIPVLNPAVGGPSRVSYSGGGRILVPLDGLFESLELAPFLDDDRLPLLENGHARGVVPSILELAQTLNDDRDCLTRPNVPDDSTHVTPLLADQLTTERTSVGLPAPSDAQCPCPQEKYAPGVLSPKVARRVWQHCPTPCAPLRPQPQTPDVKQWTCLSP